MTENEVIQVLQDRHTRDLFVPHCKNGPSYGDNVLIMDAWVMPFSWVKPIIGYEVKVSRQDFFRDQKWKGYLEYCHLFYFVTPWGLVDKTEIPPEAGLIWVTKNGKAIRYQKRPWMRERKPLNPSIFMYVLMWRSEELRKQTIVNDLVGFEEDLKQVILAGTEVPCP